MLARLLAIALCGSYTSLPDVAHAQAIPKIVLKPADATLRADFVSLTHAREVADGRVILTDGRAQQLYLADFMAGTAAPLGRKGKGPLEWMATGWVHRTTGDSSIMPDFANRRWLLFDGAKVVGMRPPDDPAVRAALTFYGADARGRVLIRKSEGLATSGVREYTRKDSQVVALVSRSTGRADTVARIREMPRRYTQTVNATGGLSSYQSSPTESGAQGEEAWLCNDGTIAVIRLEPLRVDWRTPDGRWILGRPFALSGEPVDAKERAAIVQSRRENREEMRRLGLRAPPEPPIATTLPALRSLRPIELPDGRIALWRRTTVSQPAYRYVIVNRRGTIDGELTLKVNENIVGFGARSVYVAFRDEDDVERLRRHPWP